MSEAVPPSPAALAARLDGLTLADAHRLGRRLEGLRRHRKQGDPAKREAALAGLTEQIDRAERVVARRAAAVPTVTFPEELPISARVDDVAAAIRDHQVVILAGETGSGKSTQLPKICLQLGRGVRGMIGHTQPRRIAARALAERIAEETDTELGGPIGYAIRFGDHTGPQTLVKLMTDGILLAEINRDRDLLGYDTIIIDEAHERSLNIDFLLGYLTELLPRRPDLKVIITSATIDPQRFSRHFGDAPIVEVSGRTYPVEVRYRPFGPLEGTDDDDDDDADGGEARPGPGADRRPAAGGAETAVDQATAICRAVDELAAEGPGDILVFLSGEREITDTADVLRGHLAGRRTPTEVLPLYGRLSMADQHKVFSAHGIAGGRRVVLATNVAETSLTVPGIRYVVDPGTARISRYSTRTKVQRLPIEKISQASAGQRAGRCGRVADGVCIRLYSAADFADRPEFTDPEIARTSLASVILQMAALNLGDIASFPFVEPPDRRQISDGITVLTELGALESGSTDHPRLTGVGRALAAIPVDPRLARMIVEADRVGRLPDVLVIVAALAIADVREYPLDDRERATASHSRFVDGSSDFLALLNLWHYLTEQAKGLSGNAFRRMCRREYLNYLRIREWQDLHGQLGQIVKGLGMSGSRTQRAAPEAGTAKPARSYGPESGPKAADQQGAGSERAGNERAGSERAGKGRAGKRRRGIGSSAFAAAAHQARLDAGTAAATGGAGGGADNNRPVDPTANSRTAGGPRRGSLALEHAGADNDNLHRSLLAGLLSHVGLRLEPGREYQGTRGTTFMIWPGSALASSTPRFVMAAELVETSRLWGRMVARVDPVLAEQVGEHLVKRQYSEPHWSARRGAVMATEKVTLLGVTLVAGRPVNYDRIDPELCRELFLRHALVEGDWQTRHGFFAANAETLAAVAEQEDRARRRDIRIDDDALFALYEARIPAEVTSARAFDAWWKVESRTRPDLLTFSRQDLVDAGSAAVSEHAFPDRFSTGGLDLDLGYVFEPGRADDGVTVTIPLAVLARVDPDAFAAQVPGRREELAVALLRTLPKTLRRNFVPAPDFARAALARLGDKAAAGLPDALAAELTAMTGVRVAAGDFDVDALPDHLRMTFRIVDDTGEQVAAGKDLAGLQGALRGDTRKAVARLAGGIERTGLTAFPHQGVPKELVREIDGHQVVGYPALVDEGATVGIRVFTNQAEQARAMRAGTRRLLVLTARSPLGYVRHELSRTQLITLATAPQGSLDAVVADATSAAVDALLDWAGGPAWDEAGFAALARKIAPHLDRSTMDVIGAGEAALRSAHRAQPAIDAARPVATAAQQADLRLQLSELIGPDFLTRTGAAHLPDLQRWLDALAVRAERIKDNPQRDADRLVEVVTLTNEVADAVASLPVERRADPDVAALRRMLAELRVATFAQPMRTALPVSAKRIRNAIASLRA